MKHWLADILNYRIASGKWEPGSLVQLVPDLLVAHDIAFPASARAFKAMGGMKAQHGDRIYIIHDHLQPAKDITSADIAEKGLKFARDKGITNCFTAGRAGILTVALDELTKLRPGMLIAGTDTHMPTYGAFGLISLCIGPADLAHAMHAGAFWFEPPPTVRIMLEGELGPLTGGRDVGLRLLKEIGMDGGLNEFFLLEGPIVDSSGICSRRQLCNLMVEAGAVGSFMRADSAVASHLGISEDSLPELGELECDKSLTFDLSALEPQVALPGRPDDVHPVADIDATDVHAVFIGSCAGGSLEDLKALDEVLGRNDIHPGVRLIVVPQSAGTFRDAERLGIIGRVVEKGAYISGPGCGPCMGAHLGVLGRGEVCVSTSPRNFPGRMGSRLAKIYLANAWVAAAAAVAGKIVHPRELLG
jgi:homoaconitase/3-isopropylmalate dehydratase large subunit